MGIRIFAQVNCRNCGEGSQEKLNAAEMIDWVKKHTEDVHDHSYQGVRVSNLSQQRSAKD